MTTEAKASEKWCPLSRVNQIHVAANREEYNTGQQLGGSNCIGSLCMAWRWHHITERTPDGTSISNTYGHGYCGAFGKPTIPLGGDNEIDIDKLDLA